MLSGSLPRLLSLFVLMLVISLQPTECRRERMFLPPGPNMCKVQQVVGSTEKYFTHCVAKHLKVICERPTYVRWQCCSGFKEERGKAGCTGEKPLGNLLETAAELGLTEFLEVANSTGLADILATQGAYTVFAPTDEAFSDASPGIISQLTTSHNNSFPLLKYHMSPGRLKTSDFLKKTQDFPTLHNGIKIRANKYAYGVATINCARVVRPNEKATNGIIHVIDRVLHPNDVSSTLAQLIETDDRFSKFNMALLVSDLVKKLNSKRGSFTVLAPTNEALAEIPDDLLQRIMTDAATAEKVLKNHIIRGVHCADAIVVTMGLKTLGDDRLLFRCKRDGLTIGNARVLHPDIMAANGVIHGINKVMIPDEVKNTTHLLRDMRLTKFGKLIAEAGLNETLDDDEDLTLFIPTDKAFEELPKDYVASLEKDPKKMKELLKYHIVPGKIPSTSLIGNTSLETLALEEAPETHSQEEALNKKNPKRVRGEDPSTNRIIKTSLQTLTQEKVPKKNKPKRVSEEIPSTAPIVETSYMTLAHEEAKTKTTLVLRENPSTTPIVKTTLKTLVQEEAAKKKKPKKVKVSVVRSGIMIDKATIQAQYRTCRNGVIQRVDKVLIPPIDSLMGMIMDDPNLSEFSDMLFDSGISRDLWGIGSYTILAPTNRALSHIEHRQLDKIKGNSTRLKGFVERHMIRRMVLKCQLPKKATYSIKSLQGDVSKFTFDWKNRITINRHTRVTSEDIYATNGILYKVDHVLPCSCERSMRTNQGQYLSSTRYRRRY